MRILLVDDDTLLRDALSRRLRALMSGWQRPDAVTPVWERFSRKPDDVDDIIRRSVAQSRNGGA